MSSEELDYKETLLKLTERLTFITLSIKERKDLTEDDWNVLERVHWCHRKGYLPLYYKNVLDLEVQNVTQSVLFTDNSADTTTPMLFGTDVDVTTPEN